MRRAALLVAVLVGAAACRTEGGIVATARIRVLAGDQVAPGVSVLAHAPTGAILDEDKSDAVGIADLYTEADSLITVQFDGYTLTTLPPAPDTTLEIHGPPASRPSLVVGVLDIAAPALAGALTYKVDVGCVTLTIQQFPDSIDIAACSQGTDQALDVVVTAHDATQTIGYAAARVPIASGLATMDIASWQTPVPLPLSLDVPADLAVDYFADGNPYAAPSPPAAYAGLEVERTRVVATLDGRSTTHYEPGVPAAIAFGSDDFLPTLAGTVAQSGSTFSWDVASTGDAVVLRAGDGSWDVVLPPETTSFTVPDGLTAPPLVTYGYVDSSELADFAALRAAGVYAAAIVPAPTTGDVRTTTSR